MTAPGPAFQFYASDFVASTVDWSCAEIGLYIRLLAFQWEHGEVPVENPERMLRISGCLAPEFFELWGVVGPKFPGGVNKRLDKIRAERVKFVAAQTARSAKGVAARSTAGSTERLTAGLTTGSTERCTSPSPSPSPSLTPSSSPLGEKKPTKRRGRFCPWTDIPLDLELWTQTEFPQLDHKTEGEKFLDHEFDKPKSDWKRVYRNWIRNAAKWQKGGTVTKEQTRTANHRALAEKIARGEI